MNLLELKEYLQKRNVASLGEIASYFRTDALTIGPMLDIWIKKGKVRRHACNRACSGTCCGCESEALEIYEWKGR